MWLFGSINDYVAKVEIRNSSNVSADLASCTYRDELLDITCSVLLLHDRHWTRPSPWCTCRSLLALLALGRDSPSEQLAASIEYLWLHLVVGPK